jgi:hypothetical protein
MSPSTRDSPLPLLLGEVGSWFGISSMLLLLLCRFLTTALIVGFGDRTTVLCSTTVERLYGKLSLVLRCTRMDNTYREARGVAIDICKRL